MIARAVRARSGITLTEILIAILIMGVGLISLATLFPLGLIRLREATRSSRAGLTFEVAADDMDARALFYKPTFTQTWYWTFNKNNQRIPRDPFVQDADPNGLTNGIIASNPGVPNGRFPDLPNGNFGPPLLSSGLPFCYDPLWRSIIGVVPHNNGLADPSFDYDKTYVIAANEARFGDGLLGSTTPPYLRPDPGDGLNPSAHGLQRLTNFIPWSNQPPDPQTGRPLSRNSQYPFTLLNKNANFNPPLFNNQPPDVAGTIFASNDDIVFNAFPSGNSNAASPLVPDMSGGAGPQADYRFTWFVTGRQLDAGGNGTQFVGEVVVCDGRQFGFDPLPGLTVKAPAGETVVEAIFGYGPPGLDGFSTAKKSVLLRWPVSLPDPQVRAGGWICDVTYERVVNTYASRTGNSQSPFARCYWYQVGKRTEPQAETSDPNIPAGTYRSMVLTLTSPVRDQTSLKADGTPVHLNVALVMPSVINVFPRAFEVH